LVRGASKSSPSQRSIEIRCERHLGGGKRAKIGKKRNAEEKFSGERKEARWPE